MKGKTKQENLLLMMMILLRTPLEALLRVQGYLLGH